jgi:nucleoside-diphosphate-sugar epimerase
MMNCIISGITGLIGSRFYELYGDNFQKIYQLGRSRANVNLEWIEYDLSVGGHVEIPEVDVFFHFAGQTSFHLARENITCDLNVNLSSFIDILMALKNNGKKPFVVLAGTASEYGYTNASKPIDERFCSNPITFYDINKLAAEQYLLQFVREGWVRGCALRLCNVYGGTKEGQNVDRGIIDKVFQRALKNEPISIFGSGDYLRDYIHIDDVASAFYSSWEHRDKVDGECFNIGTGTGVTLKDAFHLVVRLAEEVSGQTIEISEVEPPPEMSLIEFRSFVADNKKFSVATGWSPRYSLEEGIRYSYGKFFEKTV